MIDHIGPVLQNLIDLEQRIARLIIQRGQPGSEDAHNLHLQADPFRGDGDDTITQRDAKFLRKPNADDQPIGGTAQIFHPPLDQILFQIGHAAITCGFDTGHGNRNIARPVAQ